MTGLIVLSIITAYIIGALVSAPKLMRLIYQEKVARAARIRAAYEKDLERWRTSKDRSPYAQPLDPHRHSGEPDYMNDARFEGWWWSLVWPFALTFHSLGATAFKQEIAAQQATANAKVIADYEALLAESFDKELAAGDPDTRVAAARKLIRTLTRKEHS